MIRQRFFYILLLLMISLSACQPQGKEDYDKPLEEIIIYDPAFGDQILPSLQLGLTKEEESRRTYLMQTGDTGFEQTHYVSNSFTEDQYQFREIYNSYYDSTMGRLELYVSEFQFDPDSTDKLFKELDYRILLKGDSAFLREPTFSYLLPSGKKIVTAQDQEYEVFAFEGYSPLHIQQGMLPDISQQSDFTQFWSPQIGIIKVTFGQGKDQQNLELQAAGNLQNQDIISDLRKALLETKN